jgi:hypothetical protein
MENIEIKGLELLSEEEKFNLNKQIESYKEKIKWKTKSEFVLKLAIKIHSKKAEDKDSKRRNYSLQAILKGETHSFESNAEDWDFHKVCHKVFEKLLVEVEHAYHSSEQRSSGKK